LGVVGDSQARRFEKLLCEASFFWLPDIHTPKSFDAIMFGNEGNRHYLRKATPESLGNGRRPFEPSPDTAPAYDLFYKIYRTIYESLKALFSQLAETRNLALEH
jgi:hypothetical protein